jgi:hypothetical protein
VTTRDKREKMRTRMLFWGLVLIDVVWGCCFSLWAAGLASAWMSWFKRWGPQYHEAWELR